MLLKLCWKNTIFVIIIANGNMNDIEEILTEIRRFNQDRDWDQFHNGKDLAIAISLEAAELLEPFLWKSAENVPAEKIREELADVLNYAFQMADKYDLDIKEIILDKIKRNAEKYPVSCAKGSAQKYTAFKSVEE